MWYICNSMNLPGNIRRDIHCFSYFLFRGTLDPRLIKAEYDYLDKLLSDPASLYNCFKVFTYASMKKEDPSALVGNYIISLHNNESAASKLVWQAEEELKECRSFWKDFLVLARWFCFNSFPEPVNHNYIPELHGCGTDGVPTFAVWTNVVQLDEDFNVLNSEFALQRANQRIKLWDGQQPVKPFENWELEQELY